MPSRHFAKPADNRLRFVFDDAVLSFSLAADATFEEIALKFGEVSNHHPGKPVAIDVRMSTGEPARAH